MYNNGLSHQVKIFDAKIRKVKRSHFPTNSPCFCTISTLVKL